MRIEDAATFISGTPQFRILQSLNRKDPVYKYYSQLDLEVDLASMTHDSNDNKTIRTKDEVVTANKNDLVFNLSTGQATVVMAQHQGYLLTQNFLKIIPNDELNAHYLVYLLNESIDIRHQFILGMQGSKIVKYTVRQLKNLKLARLPTLKQQKVIGEIYFQQMHLFALNNENNKRQLKMTMNLLEEINGGK